MLKRLLFLAALALLSGCAVGRYSEVKGDKPKTTFVYGALFHKDSIRGLNVNSSTEKTRTGLRLQSGDGSVDSEGINAAFIGKAAGIAAKTALKP